MKLLPPPQVPELWRARRGACSPQSTSGCQAWLKGPAATGDILQPGSEFIPQLRGPVHAEERGLSSLKVSLPLHEGGEGGDTVANKVVSSAEDVQVYLGHLRLQAHYLHLQKKGRRINLVAAGHGLELLPWS